MRYLYCYKSSIIKLDFRKKKNEINDMEKEKKRKENNRTEQNRTN